MCITLRIPKINRKYDLKLGRKLQEGMETTDSFLYKVNARAFLSAIIVHDLFYIVSSNMRDFANQGL